MRVGNALRTYFRLAQYTTIACLLVALFHASAFCTDVLVSSVSIPNFNPTGIGQDRNLSVGVTNGSATVTSAGLFRTWIGQKGFTVSIEGTRYVVANVVDANTLILTSAYASSSSSTLVTMVFFRYIEVRLYVSLAFQPLGKPYLVPSGTPDTANFYQRFYASVINEDGTNKLFIPQFTIDATTDAPVNNTAKYTIGFYRPDGSRLEYYRCGNVQQLAIPPSTPTTLAAICTYNQSLVIITDNSAYTKPQIDARFPSCASGKLYGFTSPGNALACVNIGSNLTFDTGTATLSATGGGGGGTISGSGTADRIPRFTTSTDIGNSIMSQVGTSEFKFAATGKRINLDSGSQVVVEFANETVTGTIDNRLAKLTDAPSKAIVATTSDTGKLIGVVVANGGASGNVQIAVSGNANCDFDGATTAGNYVGASTTTGGKCTDLGSALPTSGAQVIGRVLSTNASGGVYSMYVFSGEQRPASMSGSGTTNYVALWGSASTLTTATDFFRDAVTDPANPEYVIQDNLHIYTTNPSSQFRIDTDQIVLQGSATRANGDRMFTLKGKSGQTGDFIRATDNSGTALFGVDSSGNVRIRQLPYTWPAAHTANGALVNNGSGTLSWSAFPSPAGTTNSIQINNGGSAFDGGNNALLDLLTSTITLGTSSSQNGRIQLRNATNANVTNLIPGAPSASITLTLPATLPASAGCLQVDSGGVITQTGSACGSGSSVWSSLSNPVSNLSLSMGTSLTTFSWATGTSTNNLFNLTTAASANGTGYLLNVNTGASATVKPLSVTAGGTANGIEMTAAGVLQTKGGGQIQATPPGVTFSIPYNNGAGLFDSSATVLLDPTSATITLGDPGLQNGRLQLRNATNSNVTNIIPGAPAASNTLTLPIITDTITGNASAQTLTNKTLTSSTNVLGGVTMTLGSDATGDIYYRNSSGVLTRLGVGTNGHVLTLSGGLPSWAATGSGTVTSVGASFTGGLISVSGSPVTTTGTLALTVAGTSGGIPYFSSASTWASSAVLAANAIVLGGGAGTAPATTTTGTGVVTALGVNVGSAGAFVVNGGALGTPSSGVLTNATGLPPVTGIAGWPANASGVLTNNGSGALSWGAATASLTATRVGFGDGSNLLSGSANLTWDETNKILTATSGSTTFLRLAGGSTASAVQVAYNLSGTGAIHPGSGGGLLMPLVGGSQSSGPGIWWTNNNYNATAGIWISNGFNFQGHSSSGSPLKVRKGSGTSSDGGLVFTLAPDTGVFQLDPFGTSATNTSEVRQLELAANGTNYFATKPADNIGTSYTLVWPTDAPVAGESLNVSSISGGTITSEWYSPTLWRSTAQSSFDTTASATSIIADTGSGTKTLAANQLKVGSHIKITASGLMSTKATSAGTFTITLINGSTTMATIGPFTLPDGLVDSNWTVIADGAVNTASSSGVIYWTLTFFFSDLAAAAQMPAFVINSTSINTTVTRALDIQGQFSVSDASNFFETKVARIEVIP